MALVMEDEVPAGSVDVAGLVGAVVVEGPLGAADSHVFDAEGVGLV